MPHNPFLIKANLCAYVLSRFCVCNDIPLESKEVPIRREKNGVLSYMDLQKDEECHLFRSYFIFDVATKRIPLKGCFYVPDVLLPGNLHLQNSCTTTTTTTSSTTTGHHATNHFFREKSRKKLGQIAFLLGQYAQKACFARARLLPCLEGTIRRKGKQSFFSCSGFLRLLFGAFIRLPKARQRAQKV